MAGNPVGRQAVSEAQNGGNVMERLTERDANCADPKEIYGVRVKNHDYISAANRLADYEDTGLTPQEVLSMKFEWCAMMDALNSIGGGYTRLRELAEADMAGRLEVLPCKVGDTLYEVTGRKTISVYKVRAIRVELFGLFIEWDIVEGFVWQSLSGINAGDIGKTVFLTREEAEKALEAMKDE